VSGTVVLMLLINLLKPTGHVMHYQFNIHNRTLSPHCIYAFCIYLRTNSDLCHLHHKLIGFYNRVEKCLLHDTYWVFKLSSLRFVCKGLNRLIQLLEIIRITNTRIHYQCKINFWFQELTTYQ
jgi:hypothetical protein